MVMPTPRRALPHSAELKHISAKDKWGKAEYTVTALEHIRVELISAMTYSVSAEEPRAKAKLYFDTVNSLPRGVSFVTNDIIVYLGKEYTITEVRPFSADMAAIHHYEVMLG